MQTQTQASNFAAPAELKFLDGEPEGTIGGLGAVFGNVDSHGDVIEPGAFEASLAEHKARGTRPAMFIEHSAFTGGDPLPIGVWESLGEEPSGLRVKGRLVGMSHPTIQRVAELVRERVIGGMSIAFSVPDGGATFGKSASEPRRKLSRVNLIAVDLVGDPSNHLARIDNMKSVMVQADHKAAAGALARAMALHRETMSGGNSPTTEQRATMMEHLQTAHMALTGSPMPPGMKAMPTLREYETAIGMMFGLTNSQARAVTEHGLKSWLSRDGEETKTVDAPDQETLETLRELAGFSLPSF